RHATDVLGLRTRLRQYRHDVLQRLLELRHDVFGLELLLRVPADLAGDEYDAAGVDRDAVGVTDRRGPAVGEWGLHAGGPRWGRGGQSVQRGGSGSSAQSRSGFGTLASQALINSTCSRSSDCSSSAAERTESTVAASAIRAKKRSARSSLASASISAWYGCIR